ncbi:hypothetical protein SEA_JANUS_31 [Streptomyces phage Janus]|uniref:Uncharacterized protein n=1 Tax=Streptomyces phage Janus TaxID=2510525 RepID=A0A411CPV2_9CAUD|nr:hypothetical protein KGG75_gp31 [Streptomyces phage Janus]QAY15935.1 hypothetical protein SEA_JANUS_31 [Streptomyces phage Janus]
MANQLGEGPTATPGGWRGEYTSPGGNVTLVVDEEAYDFHIIAAPDHKTAELRRVIDEARRHGLELLDDDEVGPEILEDDSIKIYLCPTPTETTLRLVVA